jgi:hypothetical protein
MIRKCALLNRCCFFNDVIVRVASDAGLLVSDRSQHVSPLVAPPRADSTHRWIGRVTTAWKRHAAVTASIAKRMARLMMECVWSRLEERRVGER